MVIAKEEQTIGSDASRCSLTTVLARPAVAVNSVELVKVTQTGHLHCRRDYVRFSNVQFVLMCPPCMCRLPAAIATLQKA